MLPPAGLLVLRRRRRKRSLFHDKWLESREKLSEDTAPSTGERWQRKCKMWLLWIGRKIAIFVLTFYILNLYILYFSHYFQPTVFFVTPELLHFQSFIFAYITIWQFIHILLFFSIHITNLLPFFGLGRHLSYLYLLRGKAKASLAFYNIMAIVAVYRQLYCTYKPNL